MTTVVEMTMAEMADRKTMNAATRACARQCATGCSGESGCAEASESGERARCERLRRLEEAIRAGSYFVPAKDVAECLMHHMLAC